MTHNIHKHNFNKNITTKNINNPTLNKNTKATNTFTKYKPGENIPSGGNYGKL